MAFIEPMHRNKPNITYLLDQQQAQCWHISISIYSWDDLGGNGLKYRQVSNISRTKSQHLKDSRTVLQLSLSNPLKPDVKSRMKM